jgi:hypothetical protein
VAHQVKTIGCGNTNLKNESNAQPQEHGHRHPLDIAGSIALAPMDGI